MPASKAGPDFRAFRVTSEWRYDVEVDNILPQQRGTLWARRSISALEIDDPCRHGIISINSNSNQFKFKFKWQGNGPSQTFRRNGPARS